MSWSEGYVADVGYTYGYFRELAPSLMGLCLLAKGVEPPRRGKLKYLELGFGQGVTLNIHAAANEGEFWGTDFNPAHASGARELARASGADLHVFDASFAELAARDDLPEFDIIALHGIWSWISAENRRVIVDIARRKLAAGGILYISYNTTPGWAPAMPLRHLMILHKDLATNESLGLLPRIDSALNFASRLEESKAGYFRANPALSERLKKLKGSINQPSRSVFGSRL